MTKTLYLFTGLTPNIKGHPYYNIKAFDNYLLYLREHYYCKVLTDDNYRINANIIKIENVTSNNLFTYAIEVDSEGAHRCYFINSITKQSNMLYLGLTIDYWGTYYTANKVDYLHIIRCNRNIGNGLYDDVRASKGYGDVAFYFGGDILTQGNPRRYVGLSSVFLIFSLSYNLQENITGEKNVSTTELMGIRLSQLKDFYVSKADGEPEEAGHEEEGEWIPESEAHIIKYKTNIFDIVSDFLGGVIGVSSTFGTNKANVNMAYIVHESLIEFSSHTKPFINAKSLLLDKQIEFKDSDEDISIFYYLRKQRRNMNYTIHHSDVNINKVYYLGVEHDNGLLLPRVTQDLTIYYVCEASNDKLNIYCEYGEKQFDLTNNFIFVVSENTNYTSPLRMVASSFVSAMSIYMGMSKAYARSGATIAGLTGASGLISASGLTGDATLNKDLRGNGDASITYNEKVNDSRRSYLQTPFAVTEYESLIDEKAKARVYGASFDKQIEDINSIFAFALLGEGDYNLTFLISDDVKINYLPTMARQEIENAFTSGVELLDYE